MPLPVDFDRDLWLDPLTFEGLIGATLASDKVEYHELFRPDGFAKPISDLKQNSDIADIAKLLEKIAPLKTTKCA